MKQPSRFAAVCALAATLLVGASFSASAAELKRQQIRVEPKETDELLANPGMGWQTFHRFADEDKNLRGLPSSSAYFRFYWREIEPQPGQIDFTKFDDLLAHGRRARQKLAFRVMCTGSSRYIDCPDWLKEMGCRGFEFTFEGRNHWVPDFTDERFREAHFRLIRELGQRYDGHPDLDLVDIGSVGLWAEWHMSGTKQVDTGKPVALPPLETRLAIIDAWCNAFPRASKVMLIGSAEGMARATQQGYGWRADCLGDMGGFSKTWNHMDNFYLQQLTNSGALDAWKLAPVAFESCWDMRKWDESGWNVRFIFEYALACHASYINNKSAPIPEGTRDEVERLLRKLGYRLVIRTVEHSAMAHPGADLKVTVGWENVGVAPPYHHYPVALRLREINNPAAKPIVFVTPESIRGWLPHERRTELAMPLPGSISKGQFELAIGVVDPESHAPAVRLAITGRDPEGWYPVSKVVVESDNAPSRGK